MSDWVIDSINSNHSNGRLNDHIKDDEQ